MFLLHLTCPCGGQETLSFPSAFSRALVMITLAAQPMTLRILDREQSGSEGWRKLTVRDDY